MSVNLKSTKKEIWEAYQEALKNPNSNESNVTEIKKRNSTEKSIQVAEDTDPSEIAENVKKLKGEISHVLYVMERDIVEKKEQYSEICKAVEAKNQEFKQLTDIEVEYDTLFLLREQAKVHQKELDDDYAARRKELADDFEQKKKENKTLLDLILLKSSRQQEELEYEYERKKKNLEDQVSDLEAKIATLTAEKEKLANIDNLIEKEANKIAQKIVDDNRKEIDQHMLVSARKHENDLLGLQKDVEMFRQANQHLTEENEQLKKDLKEYREQVSQISKAALTSKSAVVNVSKASN